MSKTTLFPRKTYLKALITEADCVSVGNLIPEEKIFLLKSIIAVITAIIRIDPAKILGWGTWKRIDIPKIDSPKNRSTIAINKFFKIVFGEETYAPNTFLFSWFGVGGILMREL